MPKHIARLIALIVAFGAVALLAKSYFTVDSFYEFGHYRGKSVPEIAAQVPAYQTTRYCQPCHAERVAVWSANGHKTVICEVCHGAAQGHPAERKLPIPTDTRKLCTLCHEAMPGRPSAQLQIDVAQHYGGQPCIVCHNPHAPKTGVAAVQVPGDVEAGRNRASGCAGCHGAQGMSANDMWPNLAGQNAAYLARVLAAYKSGARKDPLMTPMAAGLGDADVQNLAAHFGSLSCAATRNSSSAAEVAAGKVLAKTCASCHGETGVAINSG